jgi:hypothetical protein
LKSFEVVITDEGLGSLSTPIARARAVRREGGAVRHVAARLLGDYLGPLVPQRKWPLFQQATDGTWTANERIAESFRRLTVHPPSAGPTGHSNLPDVLYLTQPLPELGLVDLEDQLERVSLFHRTVTKHGLTFGVKPHPSEPSGRYTSVPLVEVDRPIELDGRVAAVRAVVGSTSTALLTTAAVWSVPAYLDTGLGCTAWLGHRQRSLFDAFAEQIASPAELVSRLSADPQKPPFDR